MLASNLQTNPYIKAYEDNATIAKKAVEESSKDNKEVKEPKIDTDAVSVAISARNVLTYINQTSNDTSKSNFNTQKLLDGLINGNSDIMNFFNGGKTQEGFSLSSIGYEGKPISQLNPEEAKDLVSENGFFGIEKTSQRVAGFAISISGNNIDSLKEARKGIVEGFEEANKLFGGKLPEISYKTQEKTLELIDKKIAELSGGDKKVES